MKPLPTLLLTALSVAFAGPSAQAAVLNANKQCYREGDPTDPVIFGGGPFAPRGIVDVARDGLPIGALQANALGTVSGILTRAPLTDGARQRAFTVVATDRSNPALSGSFSRLVSRLEVTVRPTGGSPQAMRRITARGFTGGARLYAHVVRGRRVRNVAIGRVSGPCGTVTARKRLFRKRQKSASYRVQFDGSRVYVPTTNPSRIFRVKIFTTFRPRGSAASASERWVEVR